ncbi:ESPR-type extended signal peptide-containing protein [Variovorax sp. J22P271]|uniref:ESPR-type extended signal peptide-containing protein n=1 Tax=Variovorax davisae TaxID=3053515 RepID=UPI002574ABF4|nr:ESPR-type extended signal peptide-containing protein [Variovorax sp. J22P271]MDM0037074.1 ESPR-type extended signal peptide-containing protein [Variovorax sp. J22P271]
MNKSHRSLWNESLGAWVAASELTRARGKRSSARVIAAVIVAAAASGGLSGLASAAVIGAPVQAQDGTYSSGAASATGGDSTAVGAGSKASAQGTTAVGAASQAIGGNATAVGIESEASGNQSLALGYKAKSAGLSSTAIGASAAAEGIQSIAMGASATVAAGATNGLAFGTLANAGAVDAVALGQRAAATAVNSVALGARSTTTANLGAAAYNAGSSALSGTASAANGEVSIGAAGSERRLTNLAAGAALTDAVNVSQLQSEAIKSNTTGASAAAALGGGATYNATTGAISAPSYTVGGTTYTNVGSAITNIDGRVAAHTGDIADLKISNGLVQQDAATRAITVAKGTDGTSVDFTGTAGARTLTGVAAGAVDASSLDAINGSQLHGVSTSVASALGGGSVVSPDGTVSAPSYAVGGTTVNNVGDAVTNIDGRVTTNATNIAQNTSDIANLANNVTNGTVGLVQQASAGANLTVGKATDGAAVDFADKNGNARTLKNVAAGAVDAGSLDAINGSQLHGVSTSVASALGGGSVVNANGTVSAPSYNVGGTTVHNVGDAVTNLDGRVATHTQQIAELNDSLGSGSEGLVRQDATTRAITVAKGADGTSVDFTGTAGARTLTGVATGAVNASSLDATNGSQLHGVSSSVAQALGGGSTVDANGKVTAPTYTVNNASYSNVNDALQGLAGNVKDAGSRLTVVEKVTSTGQANGHVATSGDADQAAAATGSQTVAIGAGATASAGNSVALGAGSVANRDNTVSVGSAGNERAIANVADGVVQTDAVNKRQLDTVADSARAYTDQRLNQVQSEVESVKRDANAAAAASMAVAALPQSVIPGRGMASAALSNMGGESAVAVGMSKVAENGRWVTKLAGTVNTRGNAGVSAGIGFHW